MGPQSNGKPPSSGAISHPDTAETHSAALGRSWILSRSTEPSRSHRLLIGPSRATKIPRSFLASPRRLPRFEICSLITQPETRDGLASGLRGHPPPPAELFTPRRRVSPLSPNRWLAFALVRQCGNMSIPE
eukprot:scaffold75602_cov26-Tisochrysis_lutea.AAC.1